MRVALVNSRKPRHIAPDEPWLRATMRLAFEVARRGDVVCTSVGTMGYEAALFGAAMGGGPLEVFALPNTAHHVTDCLPQGLHLDKQRIRVRDVLEERPGRAEELRDRAVIDAADVVIAVAVRSGGHMESLLRNRFQMGRAVQVLPPWSNEPLLLGNRRLLDAGAAPIEANLSSIVRLDQQSQTSEGSLSDVLQQWKTSPLSKPTLAHFTRRADGPWPGQTRGAFLEDLWHGGLRAERDGRAALRRILQMQTIRASSRLIRGGYGVVSFTAVSPEKLHELHRYRPHLVRWDFEPWGIVFDRDWLIAKNARPVQYLPSSSFRTLSKDERPWFQKHEPPACDYTNEQEWRILGDLDFSDAPREAVRIVVGP